MSSCSGVDVYTAVAGAVGALYGPLHGGANEVCYLFSCLHMLHLLMYFHAPWSLKFMSLVPLGCA